MSTNDLARNLPEPRFRRALLVVTPSERERIVTDTLGRQFAATVGLAILDARSDWDSMPIRFSGGDPRPGCLFLQSPFDAGLYVGAEEAHVNFALERHRRFVRLCKILGARRVEVLRVDRLSEQATQQLSGTAGRSGFEVGASAKRVNGEELKRQLTTVDEFQGTPPDFAAARQLLADSGLRDDQEFQGLLELREGANALAQRQYKYTVTRSSKSVLALGASLKIPAYVKVTADYSAELKKVEELQLTVNVEFPR